MKRRVVVTGLGAVTPIGNSVDEFWAGIRAGRVGIGPITKFDTAEYKVKVAAEVKGFSAKDRMDFKAAKRMEPFAQYAVAAAKEYGYEKLAIAGGVASNSALRAGMKEACEKAGLKFYYPSPIFCTDNAAMIGAAAYYEYINGARAGWDLNAVPNLKLGER